MRCQKKAKVSPTTTTTQTIEKEVESIKQKATLLANQNDPSDALILLALDELAKTSRSSVTNQTGSHQETRRLSGDWGRGASYVVGG